MNNALQMASQSAQSLGVRGVFRLGWRPNAQYPGSFTHAVTQEEIVCHRVRVPLDRIQREVALLAARITHPHPHVCKLVYYHPDHTPQQLKNSHRDFSVYTQRLQSLNAQDWTTRRIGEVAEALAELTREYGQFEVDHKMVGLSQRGEVKVWISCNPAFNHPDLPLHSPQEALSALTQLVLFANPHAAALLKPCRSIHEALETLNRARHKGFSRMFSEAPIRRDSSAGLRQKKNSPSHQQLRTQPTQTNKYQPLRQTQHPQGPSQRHQHRYNPNNRTAFVNRKQGLLAPPQQLQSGRKNGWSKAKDDTGRVGQMQRFKTTQNINKQSLSPHSQHTSPKQQQHKSNFHEPTTPPPSQQGITIINNNYLSTFNQHQHHHFMHTNTPPNPLVQHKTPQFTRQSPNTMQFKERSSNHMHPQFNVVQQKAPLFFQQRPKRSKFIEPPVPGQVPPSTEKTTPNLGQPIELATRKNQRKKPKGLSIEKNGSIGKHQLPVRRQTLHEPQNVSPKMWRSNQYLNQQRPPVHPAPPSPHSPHSALIRKVQSFDVNYQDNFFTLNNHTALAQTAPPQPTEAPPPTENQIPSQVPQLPITQHQSGQASPVERPNRNKTTEFNQVNMSQPASHHRSLKQNDREFIMALSHTSHQQHRQPIPEVTSHPTDEPNSPASPLLPPPTIKQQVKMQFASLLRNESNQPNAQQKEQRQQNAAKNGEQTKEQEASGEGVQGKIKQKQKAFAELKKEALAVLTDF